MNFTSSDRGDGQADSSDIVTAYDVGKARNEEGEKELTAHFERKKEFDNMEFDGKASQTKQTDNTLKVESNVTCMYKYIFHLYLIIGIHHIFLI